ncbi:MAG: DUF2085 domain-containing protein [Acidobacteriota bacterium]|nr:DUF2085 domain-containing protein [Acidobacteriota bacterium]
MTHRRRPTAVRAGLWAVLTAIGAAAFVAGLVVSPAASDSSAAAFLFDHACSLICHQLPQRTLTTPLGPMAVCARCFGLYLGGALSLIALAVTVTGGGGVRAPSRWWLLALLPTGVDAWLHLFLGVGTGNRLRALVSLPAGAVLGWLLAYALDDLARMSRSGPSFKRRSSRARTGTLEESG